MIIPYSTDAPIYHFPKCTIGVIAVNVAVFALWWVVPPEAIKPYAMELGAGLHPLQWVTHNFLHADIFHLGFNMVFLWAYGIIVEGKIGWLPFLLTYLGIGTLHGAAVQVAYLRAEEPSIVLGASAIIFGLLAINMIWAPANELSCFYFFIIGFRVISNTFEMPIWGFALLQFFLEGLSMAVTVLIRGDPMSSAFLHISGAFWGLLFGVLLVKMRWVDCEGWDAFSMMAKRRDLGRKWKARGEWLDRVKASDRPVRAIHVTDDRPEVAPEDRAAKLLKRVHKAIEAGDGAAAGAAASKWIEAVGDRAPRHELMGIVRDLHKSEEWAASIPSMRALCRFYPAESDKVRLRLAFILLRHLDRPTEARRHLEQVADDRLDATQRGVRRHLMEEADRKIEDGVLELEEDG